MRTHTLLLVAVLTLLPAVAGHAMSSTDQVAWPDKPLGATWEQNQGWPAGTLGFVNDPCRQNAWRPWFSEWPNDVIYFEMSPGDMDGLNALLEKLAEIEGDTRRVVLSAKAEPRALGFTTVLEKNNGVPAVFALGSQKRLNEWYNRLPPGGEFGVHRFDEAPEALPPTLTIYVGHALVNLDQLRIPLTIDVGVEPVRRNAKDQSEAEPDPARTRLGEYVAAHTEKQAGPPAPESDRS